MSDDLVPGEGDAEKGDDDIVDNLKQDDLNDDNDERNDLEKYREYISEHGTDPKKLMDTFFEFQALKEEHEKLCKSHDHLRKLTSCKVENFSKEAWGLYSKIREENEDIPASHEGYDNPLWDFGDGKEDAKKLFQSWCSDLSLNRKQSEVLYSKFKEFNDYQNEVSKGAYEEHLAQNRAHLEKLWGSAYNSKLESIEYYLDHVAPRVTGVNAQDGRQLFKNSGGDTSAWIMAQMAAWGDLKRGSATTGYNPNVSTSPMDANAMLENMKGDSEIRKIRLDKNHPKHEEVMNEFNRLLKIKHGEK